MKSKKSWVAVSILFAVCSILNVSNAQVKQPNRRVIPNRVLPANQKNIQNRERLVNTKKINVSQKREAILQDPNVFVDERGKNRMFFDIIKKADGNFVLAYGASSENTTFYTKGVLFTLRPDLKQIGGATIISKQDEEVFNVIVREFYNGVLSIAYTCTDSRSIKSSGSRDDDLQALKYIEIGRNGALKVRSIDKQIGKYELVDLISPQNVNNILAFYNINKKGRMGLANMDLSGSEIHCNLQELASVESNLLNASAQKVQPEIGSVAIKNDRLFIYTPTKLRSSEWDLNKGLFSGRTTKPCWPVLIFDAFDVADSKNKSCFCVNDPYTVISDSKLNAQNIVNAFPFNSGDLGVLEKVNENWYFNVFNSKLIRKLPQTFMAKNVVENSIQVEELGAQKVLLFFKTLEQDTYRFRAIIYDCSNNKILWNASDILWEEPKGLWEKQYKLVKSDNNRYIALTFDLGDKNYAHEQILEYRLLNINLNAR